MLRCWPALWLLVPDIVRAELAAARMALDAAVLRWVRSVLLTVWLVFDLRVLVVVAAAMFITYRGAVQAAAQYGELVDAS